MERPEPSTLLERLVQQRDCTLEEICAGFERCARHRSERATTLSVRQLGRWMAGEVDNARPASRRAVLRRDVFDMIDRHPRPTHLPDLYRVASQLSAMLAHAGSSLSQPHAADSHARTALLRADLAGDQTLHAYIRWVQSNVAYWRGDYRDAAELAQSGQRVGGEGNDLLRLASQEA